jgi:hypothetical protein
MGDLNLTAARNSLWQAIDNWPDLVGVFAQTFRWNEAVDFQTDEPSPSDFPSLSIRPTTLKPEWFNNDTQQCSLLVNVRLWTQDWTLPEPERRIEQVLDAIYRCVPPDQKQTYVQLATGFDPIPLQNITFARAKAGNDKSVKCRQVDLYLGLRIHKTPFVMQEQDTVTQTPAPPPATTTTPPAAPPPPAIASTVFNVRNYGAIGDGVADDTAAFRRTFTAARTYQAAHANAPVKVYAPTGNYALMPQAGDQPPPALKNYPVLFLISAGNITIAGDGPGLTNLVFYMPNHANPVTTWVNNPAGSYVAIKRAGMFRIDSSISTSGVANVTWDGLTLDGNAGFTGNSNVGGSTVTGDGWDLTHKAIALDGSKPINNVVVHNCEIKNWRGEEIYGGGTNIGLVTISNTALTSTNGDCISISGNVVADTITIGGPNVNDQCYQGFENFCWLSGQKTTIRNSTIRTTATGVANHGNGVAFLGSAQASLTITGTTITNCNNGILYSEGARNVTLNTSSFSLCNNGQITSILGLYAGFVTGFSDFLIQNNTFSNLGGGTGAAFLSQGYGGGYQFNNLVLSQNTLNHCCLLSGGFANPVGQKWQNFACDSNILGTGAKDMRSFRGLAGRTSIPNWTNTQRTAGLAATAGVTVSGFATTPNPDTIAPWTDLTYLNSNQAGAANHFTMQVDPATLGYYDVGWTTTVAAGPSNGNWYLKADPTWNSFAADVHIAANSSVKIQKQSNGLFAIAP